MKSIKLIIVLLSTLWCFNSCDYLNVDDEFNDTMAYDSIFASKRNIERYMWATAAGFPDEGGILGSNYTPGVMATDEGFVTFNTGEFAGMAFVLGSINSDNLGSFNNWSSMYRIIRKCNLILSRMDEAKDMGPSDRTEIVGYTHFIRAYAYYHLLINFGPVILVGDAVLENNGTIEYYNTHRATYDETVDYICDEMDFAARFMPPKTQLSFFGRPSGMAAYALIARMRLEQASPLYNGGEAAKKAFGTFTRTVDGVHYVSQTYDETKWAVAAAAAKRVIDAGFFKLHTIPADENSPELPAGVTETADFPNGIGKIDHFKSYSELFTGETVPQANVEYIWGRVSYSILNYTKHSFNAQIMGGWNGMSVTQKVVDAYRMYDGKDINNSSPEYPYSEDGMDNSGRKQFSGYVLNNGISNMYANREMRFYASIGFSRRLWRAQSTSEASRKDFTTTYDAGGNSGRYSAQNVTADYPSTGYVITKYIHDSDAWQGTGSSLLPKGFPIIRYAEILMIYAEALSHLSKPYEITLGGEQNPYTTTVSRDLDEIAFNFNQIRYRAGLPGITHPEIENEKTFQSLLEQERMVEFLFENRRYFDVRRWGVYEEREREPIMGMDIEASEPGFYNRVIVNHSKVRNRVVNNRLLFVPLPKDEVRKIKDLDQNPGWAD